MFSCLISLSLLVVGGYCQNATIPNFFVDIFQGSEYYPYPVDTGICMKTGVIVYQYVHYECFYSQSDGEWMINKTNYTDSECESKDTSLFFSKADEWENGVYEFNCGGTESYIVEDVCIGAAGCGGICLGGPVYSIPNYCTYGGNGTSDTYRISYCDSDENRLDWSYNQGGCGNVNRNWTAYQGECEFYYTTYALTPAGTPVYSQLFKCVIDGESLITTTPEPTYTTTLTTSSPETTTNNKTTTTTTIIYNTTTTLTTSSPEVGVSTTNINGSQSESESASDETTQDGSSSNETDDSTNIYKRIKTLLLVTIFLAFY